MLITLLPIEMITQIIECLDESKSTKPYNFKRHKKIFKTLSALRLTCKDLEAVATRQLFRKFVLSASLESWIKLHVIATSPKLRVHLQILAFESHKDQKLSTVWNESIYEFMLNTPSKTTLPDVDDHSRFRSWNKTIHKLINYNHPETPLPLALDLSLLPNLKVLKAEDKWVIKKMPKSNVQIPVGSCEISPLSFFRTLSTIWDVFSDLPEILQYDFQISFVNCKLVFNGPYQYLLNMDLSNLKSLRLYVETTYGNTIWDIRADDILLTMLQHLPNLEEFHLDQNFPNRADSVGAMLVKTTNVLNKLAKAKYWPRLRHLDLRYLATKVTDFQTFVAPHAGTLQTFRLHGGLVSRLVTQEEERHRYTLPHWIRTVICPKGGGAKFEHISEQPGLSYYAENWWDDVEEEDAEEDAEEEDSEEEEDAEEEDAVDGTGEEGIKEEGTNEEDIEEEGSAEEGPEEEDATEEATEDEATG